MTQVLDDEKVVLSESGELLDDGLCHTVHEECHRRAVPLPEFVTAMCGQVLDWDEKRDVLPEGVVDCPACAESRQCPACKAVRIR